MFPTIDVENVPQELLLLMGTRMCLGGEVLGAPGGVLINQMMLRNPGSSGVLITLLEVLVSSNTTQAFVYGPTLNTLATAEPTAFTDTRVFGEGTVGQVLSEALLVPGPTFGHFRLQANRPWRLDAPRGLAVLQPGSAFSMSSVTVDVSFACSFTWLERVAQPSELNL